MQTTETELAEPSNQFITTLALIRKGELVGELSALQAQAVAAVRLTGQAAEIHIKVRYVPVTKGDGGAITIREDTSIKLPKPEKAMSIFFTNEENGLQKNDPRQEELKFRAVPGGVKEAAASQKAAAN